MKSTLKNHTIFIRDNLEVMRGMADECIDLIKNVLYGKQERVVWGCGHWYRVKDFEVDHVIPKSKGGSDADENLQLLCGNCNRIKGKKTQEYLISRVRMPGETAWAESRK